MCAPGVAQAGNLNAHDDSHAGLVAIDVESARGRKACTVFDLGEITDAADAGGSAVVAESVHGSRHEGIQGVAAFCQLVSTCERKGVKTY